MHGKPAQARLHGVIPNRRLVRAAFHATLGNHVRDPDTVLDLDQLNLAKIKTVSCSFTAPQAIG